MYDGTTCSICGSSGDTMRLEKCPICFKYFCSDCAYRSTGRRLCSEKCSKFMLLGDDDDDEDLED